MHQPDQRAPAAPGAREVLSILNALHVGELSKLHGEMERARSVLAGLGQADLEGQVREAQAALRAGDMKEFRRLLARVTARLGHLK